MNKKIVGFVLAMGLFLGLGVANVLVAEVQVGDRINEDGTNSGQQVYYQTLSKDLIGSPAGPNPNWTEASEEETNKISNICGYIAGIKVYSMDQNKNFIVYSNDEPFATFGIKEGGNEDEFVMTGLYLGNDDLKKIIEMSGVSVPDLSGKSEDEVNAILDGLSDAEKEKIDTAFKAYVTSKGGGELLKSVKVDKDENNNLTYHDGRNGTTYEEEDVAWIRRAWKHLALGQNHKVSLSLDSYGGNCTFMENNKNKYTCGYDGTVTQKFIENAAGFITGVEQVTYEADTSSTGTIKYSPVRTIVEYDKDGNQSVVWKLKRNGNSKGNPYDNPDDWYKSAEYEYSDNNVTTKVISRSEDNKGAITLQTTIYSNGRPDHVLNDKNSKVMSYHYDDASGALLYTYSYYKKNSTDTVSNPTSQTVYKYGKALGTFATTGDNGVFSYEQMITAIEKYKSDPEQYDDAGGIYAAIESFELFPSDLKNENGEWTKLAKYLMEKQGYTEKQLNNLYNMGDGYNSVGTISIKPNTDDEEDDANSENVRNVYFPTGEFPDGVDGKYVKQKAMLLDVLDAGGEVEIDGKKYKKGQEVGNTGLTVEQYINYMGTHKAGDASSKNIEKLMSVTVVEGSITSSKLNEIKTSLSNIKDGTKYKHGEKITTDSSYKAPVTMDITVKIRGGEAYTIPGNAKQKGSTVNIDPAVKGEMWSPEPTDEELAAEMEKRGIDKNDKDAVAALKEELTQTKLEAMADRLGIDKNDEQAMADLKNGFWTNSEGKTFAIVNAESINMMEGSGFQPREKGEIIMVEVDAAAKEDIINKVQASGDRTVMFMGNIEESVKGLLVIKMDRSYSGGYKVGKEEVNQMFAAIEKGDLDWVQKNTEINKLIKAAIFGDADKVLDKEEDIQLMWNTMEMIYSLANGDVEGFKAKLESVAPEQREMAINGVAAGLNAVVQVTNTSLVNDWSKGMAMIVTNQKQGNAQNDEEINILTKYLVVNLNF